MKKIVILSVLFMMPWSVLAQRWGIEQCINHAIDNNIQVKQAILDIESSKLRKQQAKFDYLPSLNASSGYSASFGRSLDPTTYQFLEDKTVSNVNSSISVGTQLFAGMTKLHNLRKSDLNLLASIEDVELLKNNITLSVTATYLQILYNKEQVTNSQNQIKTLEEQVDRTRKLVEAGSLAMGSLLELESQLAAEKYNLVTYQNTHSTRILEMVQLLELKDVNGFDIDIPDVSGIMNLPITSTVDEINDLAQGLPQIKFSELKLKVSEIDVKLAQARYYPTLGLSLNYGTSYSNARDKIIPKKNPDGTPALGTDGKPLYDVLAYPFVDQYRDNASTTINLSMQIPIFNGLTTRRNVSLARLNVRNFDYSLQLAKDKLYKDIQQAHNDATGAYNRYLSAVSTVKSSEESFHYAEQKFTAGASTSVDYTVAKNNMLNAQSMMLQAKYEYVFRVKLLDFYKGIPITL